MDRKRFLASRRPDWQRFEELLDEQGKRRRRSRPDPAEFSRLFRSISYDLSTVRSRDWGRQLEEYLNRLAARAHARFYQTPPRPWSAILSFLGRDFPMLVRRRARYLWISIALFVVPGVVTALAIVHEPEWVRLVLPNSVLEQFESMYSEKIDDRDAGGAVLMTGFYVRNNVGIAFEVFATGIFFGVGTIRSLVFNSIFFGALVAHVLNEDLGGAFFSFVYSHASFELTAIVIAGAAGLLLGDSLLRPGNLSRMESLRRNSAEAIQLALGAGCMLGLAAIVEAFWSPSSLPVPVKYAGGSAFWALTIGYLSLAGRGAEK